jgi:GINS complex subunit 2
MALPAPLNTSITPDELELVALEQLVDIVPLFRSDRIRLISVNPGLSIVSLD